tara:strand:+ start:85 stop:1956 length:1872 start_codon:yes stop_codon:yes gene_type:complete
MAVSKALLDVEIKSGNSVQTLRELNAELEKMREEIQGVAAGSEKFEELSGKIAKASGKIKTLEKNMEGLEPQQKAEAFLKMGEGIAGGFLIAQSAMGLIGVESEKLGEMQLKVQSLIGIALGFRMASEALLQVTLIKRMVAEKLASGVTSKYRIVVIAATAAQKALNFVMNLNPIVKIVMAIGLLVAAYKLMTRGGDDQVVMQKHLNKELDEFNASTKTAQAQMAESMRLMESRQALELSGAETEKEVFDLTMAHIEETLNAQKYQANENIRRKGIEIAIMKDLIKNANKEELKDLRNSHTDLQNELHAFQNSLVIAEEQAEIQRRSNRNAQRAKRKAERKAEEAAELATLTSFNTQVADLTVDNIEDINEKEVKAAVLKHTRAKEAIAVEFTDKKMANQLLKLEQERHDQEILEIGITQADRMNDVFETARVNKLAADAAKKQSDLDLLASEKETQNMRIAAVQNLQSTLSNLVQLFNKDGDEQSRKQFEREKKVAKAGALIATFAAGAKTMQDTKGGSFARLAGMAMVISAGLAQVVAINRTKFDAPGATETTGAGGGGGGLQTIAAAMPLGFSDTGGIGNADIASAISQQNQTPVKAFVIAQEVTDMQQINEEIQIQSSL